MRFWTRVATPIGRRDFHLFMPTKNRSLGQVAEGLFIALLEITTKQKRMGVAGSLVNKSQQETSAVTGATF